MRKIVIAVAIAIMVALGMVSPEQSASAATQCSPRPKCEFSSYDCMFFFVPPVKAIEVEYNNTNKYQNTVEQAINTGCEPKETILEPGRTRVEYECTEKVSRIVFSSKFSGLRAEITNCDR